jgi:hypothetical protein
MQEKLHEFVDVHPPKTGEREQKKIDEQVLHADITVAVSL